MRSALILAVMAAAAWAQDQPPANPQPPQPAVLENTGKPLVLPFGCTGDDILLGGLSCSEEEPCPVYLELTWVEGGGDKLFAVGNLHTAAVTLYSVLLASDDAGHTWREAYERMRGAGLDHVQFLDPETGWASGETLYPLPQEPFVLNTTDGGKTWQKHSIFGDNSDNRFGSIQQIYFAAKNSGSVVVDRGEGAGSERYALYESPDGESWMIKEESGKPIRLKHLPPAPEWRARADGPSQSFLIERRQGERWTRVAAFAVKLAPCKPGAPSDGGPPGETVIKH